MEPVKQLLVVDKLKEADALESKAKLLREEAQKIRLQEGRSRPLAECLCYAAYARCKCGAGFAYDPFQEDNPQSSFRGPDAWDCSAILLGQAIPAGQPGSVQHSAAMPFCFYEVKSECQPSAGGSTTRPSE